MNARLDKTGGRVLCARIDCGNELATVRAVQGFWSLVFGRGWRATGDRKLPLWVQGRARREPRRSSNPDNRTRQGEVATVVMILPAQVRCSCGLVQQLTPGLLGVQGWGEPWGEPVVLDGPHHFDDVEEPFLIRIPEPSVRSGGLRESGVVPLEPSE